MRLPRHHPCGSHAATTEEGKMGRGPRGFNFKNKADLYLKFKGQREIKDVSDKNQGIS